jgi:hypothetical protein
MRVGAFRGLVETMRFVKRAWRFEATPPPAQGGPECS